MTLANNLIDRDTGYIDPIAVHLYAVQKSRQVYGVDPYPPAIYRSMYQYAIARARDLQLEWRREHNLERDDY